MLTAEQAFRRWCELMHGKLSEDGRRCVIPERVVSFGDYDIWGNPRTVRIFLELNYDEARALAKLLREHIEEEMERKGMSLDEISDRMEDIKWVEDERKLDEIERIFRKLYEWNEVEHFDEKM